MQPRHKDEIPKILKLGLTINLSGKQMLDLFFPVIGGRTTSGQTMAFRQWCIANGVECIHFISPGVGESYTFRLQA